MFIIKLMNIIFQMGVIDMILKNGLVMTKDFELKEIGRRSL